MKLTADPTDSPLRKLTSWPFLCATPKHNCTVHRTTAHYGLSLVQALLGRTRTRRHIPLRLRRCDPHRHCNDRAYRVLWLDHPQHPISRFEHLERRLKYQLRLQKARLEHCRLAQLAQ